MNVRSGNTTTKLPEATLSLTIIRDHPLPFISEIRWKPGAQFQTRTVKNKMTVNYIHKVGSIGKLSGFKSWTSILLRWQGGLFQSIFWNIIVYILAYITLASFYQVILKLEDFEYYRW